MFRIAGWDGPDPDGRYTFTASAREPLAGSAFSQKNASSLFGIVGSGSQNPIRHRLQEIEFRKVDPNLLERNKRRIASLVETGMLKKRDRDYRPVAGTLLTREYRDKEYPVIVSADGQYEFEGRTYQSLSMIAREITGTRWSGPVFFGLKAPSALRLAAKKAGRK